MKTDVEKFLDFRVLAGLVLLAFLVFFPLLFVGYTTYDDARVSVNFYPAHTSMQMAKILATNQGRITFLWGYPILRIPYLLDNFLWYSFIRIGSFFLLIFAIFYVSIKLIRSWLVGYVAILFYLSFIQNGWEHNALTSYPFAVNFIAAAFLFSLGLYADALRRDSTVGVWAACFFYGVALANESAVLFFPLYIGIYWFSRSDRRGMRTGWREAFMIVPLLLTLTAYLAAYVLWRWMHPSLYAGNSVDSINILRSLKVILVYTLSAFPFSSLHFILQPNTWWQYFTDFPGGIGQLSVVKALLSASLLYLLLEHQTRLSCVTTLRGMPLLVLLLAFLPNLLLGFTSKHQTWVDAGAYSYLYTYYSLIAFSFLIGVCVLQWNGWRYRNSQWRKVPIVLACILFAGISFAVDLRNRHYFLDQIKSNQKWGLMDELLREENFRSIPDGAEIISPTLLKHQLGIAATDSEYWSSYVYKKTGKRVVFSDGKNCIQQTICYSIIFYQDAATFGAQYLIFSPVRQRDSIASKDLLIVGRSFVDNAGAFVDQRGGAVLVNGISAQAAKGGGVIFPIENYHRNYGNVQVLRITSATDLHPENFILLRVKDLPKLSLASVDIGNGFFGWERAQGEIPWSWSGAESSLNVMNNASKPLHVKINFEVTALTDLYLSADGGKKIRVLSDRHIPVEIDMVIQPGINKIHLLSDRAAKSAGNGDPRLLSFSVRRLSILPKEMIDFQ